MRLRYTGSKPRAYISVRVGDAVLLAQPGEVYDLPDPPDSLFVPADQDAATMPSEASISSPAVTEDESDTGVTPSA